MSLLVGQPRRRYTPHATPLERMARLEAWLGGRARLWVKHDDATGLALGGNKTRKLEFLMADALDRGCDAIITCGSVQSNHCRLTAAAAAKEGLPCHLVLRERPTAAYDPEASGNNLLYRLLGAVPHPHPVGTDYDQAMAVLAASLAETGLTPYLIPMGGSNAIGALGYVACAEEIVAQTRALGIQPAAVVCASSSGGTQAGLVVGLAPANVPVLGISVDQPARAQTAEVLRLVRLASAAMGRDPPPDDTVAVTEDQIGPGYAEPTPAMVEAVRAFGRLEGIALDPVYTGKAAAGLLAAVRSGAFDDQDVVFVHTGGAPALFAMPHPAVPT